MLSQTNPIAGPCPMSSAGVSLRHGNAAGRTAKAPAMVAATALAAMMCQDRIYGRPLGNEGLIADCGSTPQLARSALHAPDGKALPPRAPNRAAGRGWFAGWRR